MKFKKNFLLNIKLKDIHQKIFIHIILYYK
jgi:hypothetical protein